ncbi:unnamed protein product, partial [Polarella glacialis]
RGLYEAVWQAARLSPPSRSRESQACCEGEAPLGFAAGALFFSGEFRVCTSAVPAEQVLLFPGSPVASGPGDVVLRLSTWLEEHHRLQDMPQLLLVCDNLGFLHAPTSSGRSYLLGKGHFSQLALLVHDSEGQLRELLCSDLAGEWPPSPDRT